MFTGTPDAGEKLLYAAYIDPGTGFVFSSIVPMVLGAIATFFASILFFLRKKIFPFIKVHKGFFFMIFLLLGIGTIIFAIKQNTMNKTIDKKVVVIGFDGLDPKIIDQGFQKGLLPNLKKLQEKGGYATLQTTMPAQSPVAWASFMTGDWPPKHGVFDFIKRDPKTYLPDLVFSDPKKRPIHSTPFWEISSKNNIPTTVLFLPDTFPAAQFKGKMVSGMGTPDILGTEGSLTLFSTKWYPLDSKWRGRLVRILDEDEVHTTVEGPKFTTLKEKKTTSIPLKIRKDAKNKIVTVLIQNQTIKLKENEFSPWIHLEFSVDFFTKIKGIAKFYLKQIGPDLELYLSPMNFDPDSPVFPISSPKGYSKELARKYGPYSTLGLPNDTWALEENIFSEEAFLRQVDDVENERKKIILGELKKFDKGLFFGYFGVTDTIQHMYWRFLEDPNSNYQNTILNYYQKVDDTLGEVFKTLKDNDVLIVLSDHGFDGYGYEININTWLKEQGYLTLKKNENVGKPLLENVDWSKTKAYSMGYNGIFINMKGREGKGIVSKNEAKSLEKELAQKLMEITNPNTGKKVMKKIYTREDLGISPDDTTASDIFLGYYKGIRSSWDTAIGAAPFGIILKRQSKWSGDHLFDPSEIPGVLFMNKKFHEKSPRIIDIVPTVLHFLNISSPKEIDGKNILE